MEFVDPSLESRNIAALLTSRKLVIRARTLGGSTVLLAR